MARPSSQRVISMVSTSEMGPTFVTQSKVVPGPEVVAEVKVIDSASAIHRTWVEMSATASQTRPGGASISVDTRIRDMAAP
jgi:hypothetical protein